MTARRGGGREPPGPGRGAEPPRWARTLVRRVLSDEGWARAALDDLDQEFRERVGRGGAPAASRWYAAEALRLAARTAWERLREGPRPHGNGRGGGTMERIAGHLRTALRHLARSPAFAAVAVLTTALGIGATVAIYSVVETVLLDPLPYEDAEELVAIWEWNTVRDRRTNVANPGNVRAWWERSDAFESMTAVSLVQPTSVSATGEVEEALTRYAHPNFFSVLGLEAAVGRTFPDDPAELDGREVVLSQGYWRRRFGADPAVVGRPVEIDGTAALVVGVLPEAYVVHGDNTDLWVGLDLLRGDQTDSGRWLMPVGRLAEGASLEAARAELETIAAALRDEFPEFNAGWSVNPVPLMEEVVGEVRAGLWILLGSVALLLAIACANVANLFLVRATERQREMAVRTSLGATGRTLAAQLLTESLLVAGLGAAVGVALAHVGTRALATRVPEAFALPRVEAAGVDGTVLLFALGVSVLTGVLFGLVPALHASRTAPADTLGAEGRSPSRRTGLVRDGLVVAEVALSVLLLSAAALSGRSLATLLAVDPGIEPESVLVGRVTLSGEAWDEEDAELAFYRDVLARLSAAAEVEAAGGVTFLPMDGLGAATSYWPGDRPPPADEDREAADVRHVVGDYFGAMGVGLLQGRALDQRDGPGAPRAAVVNRTLAERWWPGASAVGKPLVVNWDDREPWEIVGVVEDVRLAGLAEEPRAVVYLPHAQSPSFGFMHLAVRGGGGAVPRATLLPETVASVDRGVPVGRVRAMSEVVARSVARPRLTALLMFVFAALATLLASVGLYSVLSFVVSRRVREMGVRAALGAKPGQLRSLVVRRGAGLVLVGLAAGSGGALLLSGALAGLLHGVPPRDPWSVGAASALLFLVAVAACLIPAWRASRAHPAEALRVE